MNNEILNQSIKLIKLIYEVEGYNILILVLQLLHIMIIQNYIQY